VVPSLTPAPTPPPRPCRRRALRQLRPFPIVRIKGRLTGDGAYIALLTVRAPRLAHIVIRCRGEGCPKRRWAHAVALVHARKFEHRLLRAGVRLKVTVTRRGFIGKYALIRLRRGRPPWRRDLCLFPGSSRPRACPASP
jgi:HrpA-like RNA helicase